MNIRLGISSIAVASALSLLAWVIATNLHRSSEASTSASVRPKPTPKLSNGAVDASHELFEKEPLALERRFIDLMINASVTTVASDCGDECDWQSPLTISGEWKGPAHPNLEALLEIEAEDVERTSRVMDAIEEQLAIDPSVEIESARCGMSFCRAILTRPLDSDLTWEDVDWRLMSVATGMTWMRAEEDDQGGSVAYIYFAEGDESLPL